MLLVDMLQKLIHEISEPAQQRKRRRLPQTAKRHLYHMVAPLLHNRDVLRLASAEGHAVYHVEQVLGAYAAGYALTTRLVTVEPSEVAAHINYAGAVIVYHVAAGAHRTAVLIERVEVHDQVKVLFGQTTAGRTACLDRLEWTVIHAAAATRIDKLPHCAAQG